MITHTILDAGKLPIEDLALLALREGRRPRPIYQVHRWFARRFGTAFRSLLVSAFLPEDHDFWESYYSGVDLRDHIILDPFVGGGTSIVEAYRLGANVIGVDIDAVACAISDFETRLLDLPDLQPTLADIEQQVGQLIAPFYLTKINDDSYEKVLHYFWVQKVQCAECHSWVDAHPHYQLAYEVEGSLQWVFCPTCNSVHERPRTDTEFTCNTCNKTTIIKSGPVSYGKLTCPHCGYQEKLIVLASRTNQPPQWKLFALETIEDTPDSKNVPLTQRHFHPASDYDRSLVEQAELLLQSRKTSDHGWAWIPDRIIPKTGRADDRLTQYGYERYSDLFNARQLLHLSFLAEAISELVPTIGEALAMAFSNHTTKNCMMTHYAFGWRRLSPLFSVRAYRHVTRPVEINPWVKKGGRGTFPNSVRQIEQAANWLRAPKEPEVQGGFREVRNLEIENRSPDSVQIYHANSKRLDFIHDSSIDLILTDPPYFDNIAYSELSDFFLPWLQLLGVISSNDDVSIGLDENLSAKARTQADHLRFEEDLEACFREMSRVLKPEGRLVFTFQHSTTEAWISLANAIARTALVPNQLFPILGDSTTGLHKHQGSIKWDAVFVLINSTQSQRFGTPLDLSTSALNAAELHFDYWRQRLTHARKLQFAEADQQNFYRACLVAGSLGLFEQLEDEGTKRSLVELINHQPVALE